MATIAVAGGFSFGRTILDLVWAVAAALLIGLIVGWLTVRLRQRLDDPVLNTTISFAVPFLAYFPAEELDASGVLAVVAAGLVTGALSGRRFSGRDRQTQATTWTTTSFILESGVFLLMGYQLPDFVEAARDETTTAEITGRVLIVVSLLVVLRFLGIAWPALRALFGRDGRHEQLRDRLDQLEEKLDSMDPASDREETRPQWGRRRLAKGKAAVAFEERESITARGSLAIAWAGMRGVVTVAAVQTIPVGTPHRNTVVLAASLVALITLVVFGLSLPSLIARLRFTSESAEERRDPVQSLLQQLGESAIDTVGPVEDQTIDGEPVDPELAEHMKDRILPRILSGAVQRPGTAKPGAIEPTMILQRRYLDAMRDALSTERSIGAYSSATYRRVESLLDTIEQRTTQT